MGYTPKNWKDWEQERHKRTKALIAYAGGRCARCGYAKCDAALEFHHRKPSSKTFPVRSSSTMRKWDKVLAEASKCVLLCANCHKEIHDDRRNGHINTLWFEE